LACADPGKLSKAFGSAFMPLLQDLGVELHPPTIHPVHNIITG